MAKVGLQLYTVKEDVARDFIGTLKAVADMGYDGVEFAGVPEQPASEVRKVIVDLDLSVAGIVVPMAQLDDKAAFQAAVEYSHCIGSTTVLFPWLDDHFRGCAEAYRWTAALLGKFGTDCNDTGLRFLYHTHGYEFENYAGATGLDILMQETSPDVLGLEIDTYWVQHGGADPVDVYRRYSERCNSIHFKDMNNPVEKRDVEVGDGVVDTPGMLAAAVGQPANWFVVEQEMFDRPPLESARISCENLKRLVKEYYER